MLFMRRCKALLLALCLLPAGALAQGDLLDDVFARYKTLGASVAVFQNGQITWTHTYGADAPGGDPITEETAFQVGSISKMVTCIGLMQLMDAHGLTLESTLAEVLGYPVVHPRYPQEPITLRQLMTHTAALRDSTAYYRATDGHAAGLETLLTEKNRYSFYSAYRPGTHRQYSNFGGGLMGSLMETLSGQTVDDYMQKNVFEPLGVTAAYQPVLLCGVHLADMYRMPMGYKGKIISTDDTLVTAPDPDTHYTFTAGKLVVDAGGLARILMALCDGGEAHGVRILPESAAAEMITPQNHRGSVRCESKNGLFVNILTDDLVEGRTLYGHGGKAYGMLCAAYFDPTDRTGVVMLTNGCKNEILHRDVVGKLSHEIITLCYREVIGESHRVRDPFEVE